MPHGASSHHAARRTPRRRMRRAASEGRSRGTRRDSEQQEHSGTAPKGQRGVPDGYCHAPRSSVRAPEPAAGLQRARYTNVMRAISAIAEGISGQQGAGGGGGVAPTHRSGRRPFFSLGVFTV
jgi:hypothetical protein